MKYILPALLFLFVYSCNPEEKKSKATHKDSSKIVEPSAVNEYLVTDTSFGRIDKATTFDDLEKIFGKGNLQDTMDYAPEGLDSFIVTKVYSNTPAEIVVSWEADKLHKVIRDVYCIHENSPYYTEDSLRIGSTLEKLLQANGKKINFYGTGWDYGGMISSYNKGKFEKSNLFFILNSSPDVGEGIMGDQELNTDLPKVKENIQKLYIAKILLSLHKGQ